MAKATVVYKMPDGSVKVSKGLVKKEKVGGTKAIRDKETGRFEGRKAVKNGETITRRRVQKPFQVKVRRTNKRKGHIRTQSKTYEPGQFF